MLEVEKKNEETSLGTDEKKRGAPILGAGSTDALALDSSTEVARGVGTLGLGRSANASVVRSSASAPAAARVGGGSAFGGVALVLAADVAARDAVEGSGSGVALLGGLDSSVSADWGQGDGGGGRDGRGAGRGGRLGRRLSVGVGDGGGH